MAGQGDRPSTERVGPDTAIHRGPARNRRTIAECGRDGALGFGQQAAGRAFDPRRCSGGRVIRSGPGSDSRGQDAPRQRRPGLGWADRPRRGGGLSQLMSRGWSWSSSHLVRTGRDARTTSMPTTPLWRSPRRYRLLSSFSSATYPGSSSMTHRTADQTRTGGDLDRVRQNPRGVWSPKVRSPSKA